MRKLIKKSNAILLLKFETKMHLNHHDREMLHGRNIVQSRAVW